MRLKKVWNALIACAAVIGCLASTGSASEHNDEIMCMESLNCSAWDIVAMEYPATRASGNLDVDIPANSGVTINGYFTLVSGDLITYDCTYTPSDASIEFGFIAPDGLFYGLYGSNGSINKTIRVSQRGSYTLAICNNSDVTVTVTGTVNY